MVIHISVADFYFKVNGINGHTKCFADAYNFANSAITSPYTHNPSDTAFSFEIDNINDHSEG